MSHHPPSTPGAPDLNRVRGIMVDMDGCLVLSDKPGGDDGLALPGAARAIAALRAAEFPFAIFTNASSRLPSTIARELELAGLPVSEEQVLTPSVVAARVLAERHPGAPILAFGDEGLTGPLSRAGVPTVDVERALAEGSPRVEAVMIGWDVSFDRPKIQLATDALRNGAKLYCASDVPAFASRGSSTNVGVSGFIAAGLRHVSGVDWEVVGKPSAAAMAAISDVLGVAESELLIVGDDLVLESGMARANGAQSVIVTTGMTTREQAESAPESQAPTWIVDSLHEFVELLSPRLELHAAAAG